MKIFDAIQQVTPCPVTRSSGCQCDRLERINEAEETIKAIAQLEHTVDDVQGAVKFKQKPGQPTIIKGIVKGLTPGKHGFHIHEFGDLSKGCESAGGHYNPDGVEHGSLQQGHVGDLGNIIADKSGTARFQIKAERVELSDVVGRAIVIHADEDDLGKGGDEESLKTGNAGERVGCGVIRLREVVEEKYIRKTSDKHFDRNQLPQIRRPDIDNSPFTYKEGSISIEKLKPVQTQRVKGLSKKAQDIFLNNEDRPFIVDKNGYIINGHHRYDAANMLGIKKVPAIMIDADIEDVMNHFAHTTSDREVMPEHYFKKLLEKKLKALQKVNETIEASQDMSALLKGIEADLKQREKDLKKLPKKSIYDENYKSQDVTKQGRNLSAKVKQYLNGKNTILTKVKVADLDMETPGFGRIIGDLGDVNFADTTDPIVVDVDGKTILDGFHRVQKAKDIGKEEIPAYMVIENFDDDDIIEYYDEIHPVVIKAWKSVYPDVPLKAIDDEDMYMQYTTADEYEHHGGNGKDFYLSLGVQYVGYEDPAMGYINVGDAYAGNYKGVVAKIIASLFEWLEKQHPNMGVRELGIHMNRNAEAWNAIAQKVGAQIEKRGYYENFADGKVKGKSRPGRVKKAGASCKGSVTDLRAKAKKYSGEKGKMYHWCANMKTGRKKS